MKEVDRLRQIRERAGKASRAADRAEGALAEVLARLEREHGCSSLEEAEQLLASLATKSKAAERRYRRELARFEARWKKFLEETE